MSLPSPPNPVPQYSPDLNPIEHGWQKIKNAIKKEQRLPV
ncbi:MULTISPECIES: transposase [Planktothricoides]|uniref:Transposase n=1 Tax=Planktothricoides raciborskii FACHB-1370 TaxID=2949576 RepID=A0ABR8EMN7_9CYAN|nr:transposase [Planktothricoides raciborskii FACHB-1370]MBD2584461.1 transposase [Planktothricoides raciborskii FACHB-1261]